MKKTIIGAILIAVMASVAMASTTNIAENARYAPNTNYCANQAIQGNGTNGISLTTIFGDASLKAAGGSIRSEGVLVFKLPSLPATHGILTADLQVMAQRSYAANWNVDLYGVRSNSSSSAVTTNDYGAYCANASGTKIMDNWLTTNDINLIWTNHALSAVARTSLADWLTAQYDAITNGYVFLRFQPDSTNAVVDTRAYNVAGGGNTNVGYKPVLTITSQPIPAKTNICYTVFKHCNVRTNGVEGPVELLKIGRSSALSAGVLVFELPDLNGASVLSANLKFDVVTNAGHCAVNINIDAIRGGARGSAVTTTDFLELQNPPILPEIRIQTDVFIGTNAVNYPFSTGTDTVDAGIKLTDWLKGQYTNGVGGYVFLRLTPSSNALPSNSKYIGVSASSAELTIITGKDGAPDSGHGYIVPVKMGPHNFSWEFQQAVDWGYFIDGQPWVVMPNTGCLTLTNAKPSRTNWTVNTYSGNTNVYYANADINITVINPPVEHCYTTDGYTTNAGGGVFGWDSRSYGNKVTHPPYNASIGWNGTTWTNLYAGDSVTTALSVSNQTDRATRLEALAVLTVLSSKPTTNDFRPGIFRSGTRRTNPEILSYSNIITNIASFCIQAPINDFGVYTNTVGTNITPKVGATIPNEYTYAYMRNLLPGPGFINAGVSYSEGCSALYNNSAWLSDSGASSYGGAMGVRIGKLAIGSLAGWFSEEERKQCRIRLIQRAIDTYSAVKEGLCLEEAAGVLPGYSTLITLAGVMLNNSEMTNVNNGVNGVKPWWIFADYATMFHTDGIPTSDLAAGETMDDRLIKLYDTSTNRPNLNKTNVTIKCATDDTMTMYTNFWWDASRPMVNMINLKVRITEGQGASPKIHLITEAISTNGMADSERFQYPTHSNTYLIAYRGTNGSANTSGYCYGGKVRVSPPWGPGTNRPNEYSKLVFSVTANECDSNRWLWAVNGIVDTEYAKATVDPHIEKSKGITTSPTAEYGALHAGATIGNLIALYALDKQHLYKGGVDKWMIDAGRRPGYGEVMFNTSSYFPGISDEFLGGLWRREVLDRVGSSTFIYTGQGLGELYCPSSNAKLWYQP